MKEDGTFELNEKLSPEDHQRMREYWDVNGLRRNATNLGVPEDEAAGAEFWSYEEYERQLDAASNRSEDAETNDGPSAPAQPDAAPGGSSDPVQGSVSNRQGEGSTTTDATTGEDPALEGDQEIAPRAFADTALNGVDYDKWTNAQLKTEIQKRNADRAEWEDYEAMSASGNHDALVQTLREDDAEDAASEE